ncbi:MAG: redoxin domain-containing protein [Puia sp.]|nr:redoxin domain-containing protein [Puia sp.]
MRHCLSGPGLSGLAAVVLLGGAVSAAAPFSDPASARLFVASVAPLPVPPPSPPFTAYALQIPADEHKTLPIGARAPDFSLQGVDGRTYTLSSFNGSAILVIVFTCDHCPTAQAYEDRVIQLTKDYKDKGVAVVAIMPNDPGSVNLDELGYTDLGDSYEEMKIRASEKNYNFPYLYDGQTESTAKAYGPVATPHVFIFDKDRKLRYQGRIDDVEKPGKVPHTFDARNAIDALLGGREVAVPTTKVFGCSIKWAEKGGWVERSKIEWAKEPVKLDRLDVPGIRELLANKTDKLLLLTIWSASGEASLNELPEFITINRMYRKRDFGLVTISTDGTAGMDKALQILQKAQASCTNYITDGGTLSNGNGGGSPLVEAVDPHWQGGLPYTLLVEPGGKIVYSRQGLIDPRMLKKTIVDNRLIGRYY